MISLTSTWDLAAKNIQKAQEHYTRSYDRRATYTTTVMRVGDWVLVYMPQDESGPHRKLSRPWHGLYRVISVNDPDVSLRRVYFPQDCTIQVHQSCLKMCAPNFRSGFYWCGGKRRGPGRLPQWVLDSVPVPSVTGDPAEQASETSPESHGATNEPMDSNTTSKEDAPMTFSGSAPTASRPTCKYPL